MLIPRWLIAMLIVCITVIYASKYGFEYLGIKDTNEAIRFSECLRSAINQNLCATIMGVK